MDVEYRRKLMKIIHDAFYELYENFIDDHSDNIDEIQQSFSEIYMWFEHYNCPIDDLLRILELYDSLVYRIISF